MSTMAGAGFNAAPMTQVELTISCKNLIDRDTFSKSDPMVVVSMKNVASGRFNEIARTERLMNTLNPEFAKKIVLDYYFEESQKLKFEVYDIDSNSTQLSAHDFLGRTECTLGEIVGAPGGKIHKALSGDSGKRNYGSIQVMAEELGSSKEVAFMQFQALKVDKKDFLGKSDPFLMIYRINDDNSQTLAYRTEVIKNNLNPVWKPFKVSLRQLCNSNPEKQIKIECFDYDNDGGSEHDFIGTANVTFAQLQHAGACFDLINPKKQAKKKSYKNSGTLKLMQCQVQTQHSFLDYIRGGTEIHFTVAVDFTASNGNPMNPQSLHYINSYTPNQYQMALKAVGEICQDYSSDKLFPALGFGARLPPQGVVSHEFFLNFQPDPRCIGVQGIMEAYQQCIQRVTLYGPTNFSPVVNHVARIAASSAQDGSHYFVLLIITDGVISDFEQTKSSIVNASGLPMSIIIVGVGSDPFEAMDALDADKQRLSAGGRVAERDIVQFVPFRDFVRGQNFELSQAALAKEVLYEIPAQLTGWMEARRIQPKPPRQVDFANLAPAPPSSVPMQAQPMNNQQFPGSAPMPPNQPMGAQAPPYSQQPAVGMQGSYQGGPYSQQPIGGQQPGVPYFQQPINAPYPSGGGQPQYNPQATGSFQSGMAPYPP